MALPKRRHSYTRGAKRRTHWKLSQPGSSFCPNCNAPKMPHRACPACGIYNGKTAIVIVEKDSARRKREARERRERGEV
jgi:large subunit ribosomal protein L32